jgi:hypothetical protein
MLAGQFGATVGHRYYLSALSKISIDQGQAGPINVAAWASWVI